MGQVLTVVVLFAGSHPDITNTFFARLVRAMRARGVEPQGRGVILPTVAHEETIVLEIYDGPHYLERPSWYSNDEDAR